jgi:hypothetical protein
MISSLVLKEDNTKLDRKNKLLNILWECSKYCVNSNWYGECKKVV